MRVTHVNGSHLRCGMHATHDGFVQVLLEWIGIEGAVPLGEQLMPHRIIKE